jgi:type I restriction enzyme M protein
MGEKGNDGGQFFTPREIIRAMVKVIDPKVGETVYDPGCGTGGFLAQAYEHMAGTEHVNITSPDELDTLRRRTFYGREKDNAIYPIALANLVLHNIDEPHIWHGNTLTGGENYGGLFTDAPALYDVVLMNPPFGGKEGKDAQTRFAYKTRATQVLFLQHVINGLKPGGRCGIVLDEGVLFRTNETAFVQTKRKLLDDLRSLVHCQLTSRDVCERWRRRENQFVVLHQGRTDGEDLVLRSLHDQGRQEKPTHPGAFRRVFPPAP